MAKGMRETMEVKQLSRDGHLPMKSTPESVGVQALAQLRCDAEEPDHH